MANSAFTPSTSTVTNNVPVNVPVVTKLEDSTTPASGWFVTGPTNVTTTVKQARIGSEAHIKYAVIATGTSAAFSELSINLPANITLDTVAINKTSNGRAPVGKFELTKPGVGNYTGIVYYESSSLVCRYLGSTAIPSSVGNTGPVNWDVTTAATSINIDIIVPIAEWAGSGTTTLATRAVEEYASNSNSTATANDTTSFAYGPNGSLIQTVDTTQTLITKRVRFQNAIQPTDTIILEVSNDGSKWVPLTNRFLTSSGSNIITSFVQGYNNVFGFGSIYAPVNSTDVDVAFSRYLGPGSAYDSTAGTTQWTALSGQTTRWRLRKISGGAQVGYPVSARNIVGDTTGTAVPTGMIGEYYTDVYSGVHGTTSNNWFTQITRTLGAGIWEVSCIMSPTGAGISSAAVAIVTSASVTEGGINLNTRTDGFNSTAGNTNASGVSSLTVLMNIPSGGSVINTQALSVYSSNGSYRITTRYKRIA